MDLLKLHSVTTKLLTRVDNMERVSAHTRMLTHTHTHTHTHTQTHTQDINIHLSEAVGFQTHLDV